MLCANNFISFETKFAEVINYVVETEPQLGLKELDSVNIIECIKLNTNN